jgi:phosphate transport system ATP-binding protein
MSTETGTQITSSAELPLAAPADEFKRVFDELKIKQQIDENEYRFPKFPKDEIALEVSGLGLRYGEGPYVLYDLNLQIPKNKITAIIGPSGCGKSSFLRQLNRMNEEITSIHAEGQIIVDGEDMQKSGTNVMLLRSKIGMIFQKPQPFPRSIYENIAFGPKLHGIKNKVQLDEIVETSLKDVGLWNEVDDRLDDHAYGLSGGQQQRLCIARSIAVNPSILLADEPASALDPRSSYQIEDLLMRLKEDYTVVIVTHNMQQAARISDYCLFMYNGNIIEYTKTEKMFENPFFDLTENYITGKFG